MKKIFIAFVLILAVGFSVTGLGCTVEGFDNINSFFKDKGETKTISEEKTVNSLKIDIASDNVELIEADDNVFKIEYFESDKFNYTYLYESETVTFKQRIKFSFFYLFYFTFDRHSTKIYIPKDWLTENLDIKLSSGKVTNENFAINAKKADIDISSGSVELNNVTLSDDMKIKLSSGDIELNNVTCSNLSIDVSSGNVIMKILAAASLDIEVSSGKIEGETVSIDGNTDLHISSGNITIDGFSFGSLNAKISSGNLSCDIDGNISEYSLTAKITSGNCNLTGTDLNMSGSDDFSFGTGSKTIQIKISSGNANLAFD